MSLAKELLAGAIVAQANANPFEPVDRFPRALVALQRWGLGVAGAVASAAARSPAAPAVIDNDGTVTYRELWRRSGRLASGLASAGVAPGTTVGILCRNHRGFVINTVAAIRTGADIVLLNTEVATPQLRDVLEGYAKLSLKKYSPIAARNDELKVFSGRR